MQPGETSGCPYLMAGLVLLSPKAPSCWIRFALCTAAAMHVYQLSRVSARHCRYPSTMFEFADAIHELLCLQEPCSHRGSVRCAPKQCAIPQ